MDFENKAYLAPLSQYSNLPFRVLCSVYGADATVVPLICARAIAASGSLPKELDPHERERSLGVQLFGSRPQDIKEASRLITENHPYVRFIDINCSCPVRKVVRTGAGAALLNDPENTARLIDAAAAGGLPVTIKIRKHISKEKTLEFCRRAESAGASAIFIHGRTQPQGYSGDADWDLVRHVHQNIGIPVIGSGDIRSMNHGRALIKGGSCSSFMIGRAAMGDPEIFSNPPSPSMERKSRLFMEYIGLAEKFGSLNFADLRQKALQFFCGFDQSSITRRKIGESKTLDDLMERIQPVC